MSSKSIIAKNLASALLAGAWALDDMVQRGKEACGRPGNWLRPLVRRVLDHFGADTSCLDVEDVSRFISLDQGFSRAVARASFRRELLLVRYFWVDPVMSPRLGQPQTWPIPSLATPTQVADWLQISPEELNWLADTQGRVRRREMDRQHYVYRWVQKRRGRRLLEIPKKRLRAAQQRILREILDHIPPHECAHGFRRGRSILSYVQSHARKHILLHLDLRDFFLSIPASRIHAMFRTAGYPREVSRLLTGLCSHVTPVEVWSSVKTEQSILSDWQERQLFVTPHLPQGASTSPGLSNLCAHRFDRRVAGLARCVNANYTRYADDVLLSGEEDLERSWRRIYHQISVIALEEGFEINTRKTKVMRRGSRQHVAGVVLNEHPNVKRVELDQLKATLHNCARHGPDDQNREGHSDFRAHLLGRIAYVQMLNPTRGQKLMKLFEQIEWKD